MQLQEINFRKHDRKWMILSREKDIKKICRQNKIAYEGGIFLGYLFISHENGMQIRILGNLIYEDGILHFKEEIVEKNIVISYETDLKYQIDFVKEEIIQKIEGIHEIISEYDALYQKNSILESRKITEIDAFRHETYIDDVELLYRGKKKEEYLWARIEDCSKQKMIFVCCLLDSSKYNKNYKAGTLVLAKLEKRKKSVIFVTDGIVDKVQKENS